MKCPKCKEFQDFSGRDACHNCGMQNWRIAESTEGRTMVCCSECEIGFAEVDCIKEGCGGIIMGSWLKKHGQKTFGS
jgi:hypothetical protein